MQQHKNLDSLSKFHRNLGWFSEYDKSRPTEAVLQDRGRWQKQSYRIEVNDRSSVNEGKSMTEAVSMKGSQWQKQCQRTNTIRTQDHSNAIPFEHNTIRTQHHSKTTSFGEMRIELHQHFMSETGVYDRNDILWAHKTSNRIECWLHLWHLPTTWLINIKIDWHQVRKLFIKLKQLNHTQLRHLWRILR